MPYATVDDVRLFSTVKPADLQMTDEEFAQLTTKLIDYAWAEVEGHVGHSYTNDELAANATVRLTLESVVVRMVCNYLQVNLHMRTSPIVQVSDFTVRFTDRRVFTSDLKDALRPLRRLRVI